MGILILSVVATLCLVIRLSLIKIFRIYRFAQNNAIEENLHEKERRRSNNGSSQRGAFALWALGADALGPIDRLSCRTRKVARGAG